MDLEKVTRMFTTNGLVNLKIYHKVINAMRGYIIQWNPEEGYHWVQIISPYEMDKVYYEKKEEAEEAALIHWCNNTTLKTL